MARHRSLVDDSTGRGRSAGRDRSLSAALAPALGHPGRTAVVAAGAVLVTRLLTIAAIAAGAHHHRESLAAAVTHLDGQYYGQIARHGYPSHLTPGINAAGYFPLFPLSTRPLLALGLPFWQAALLVVTVCSVVAGALIALVVRRYAGPVVGVLTACLFAVSPLAGVLSQAYSEALTTMLAAGCLLALLHRRWVVAGVLGALAGATRPPGAVLILCCAVAAMEAVRRDRAWRSVISVVVAPIGPIAALAWIGASVGRWDAFFAEQRRGGPGPHLDGGVGTVQAMFHELTGTGAHHFTFGPEQAVYTVAAAALIVWAAVQRPPLPVLALPVGVFVLTVITSDTQAAIPRYLLPAFPMLVPLAGFLAGRRGGLIAVLAVVAALGSAAIGSYYAVFYTPSPFFS